ncbi:hypothetical protein GQ42DRAFT_136418, partial [Ramicandelaber brevisporus]
MDPCKPEARRSLRCLENNPHNRYACKDLVEAYKECKKMWRQELKEHNSKK